MTVEDVLARLAALGDPSRLPGMARYGIATEHAYGVSLPDLRKLARELGRSHDLAAGLWESGVHEARLLASMVDEPARVDDAQMERWAADFASWDLCDQACANLFRRTPLAWTKAPEWTAREELLVKRAGFALIAALAVGDKRSPDERFVPFLALIAERADDERPLVRKGASWALRQIGKRSATLNGPAIETALSLTERDSRGARWVGKDALRELRSQGVQDRLARKAIHVIT